MFKVQFDKEDNVWFVLDAGVRCEFNSYEEAEEFCNWRKESC